MSERIRPFETGDKERVCDFLAGINREEAVTPNYLWGRWAWQFGPYCSEEPSSSDPPTYTVRKTGGK